MHRAMQSAFHPLHTTAGIFKQFEAKLSWHYFSYCSILYALQETCQVHTGASGADALKEKVKHRHNKALSV